MQTLLAMNSQNSLTVFPLLVFLSWVVLSRSSPIECQGNPTGLDRILQCSLGALNFVERLVDLTEEPSTPITNLEVVCDRNILTKSVVSAQTFSGFDNLLEIKIENCKLTEINSDTFLRNLKLKNISIISHINDDPSKNLKIHQDTFSSLPLLERIYLDHNNIWELPLGVFCGLGLLRSVSLSHNRLHDVSSLAFGRDTNVSCGAELTSLELSSNDVQLVPADAFQRLSALRDLSLSHNQIAALHSAAFSGLTSLRTLDLSANRLVALPDDVFLPTQSLEVLGASNNSLSGLAPGVFRGLAQLVQLDLSRNQLQAKWLPETTFQGLIRLLVLDLSHNKFTTLNSHLFRDIYNVQVLLLSHNLLTEIPSNVFSSCVNLHKLDLSNNKLRVIGENSFYGINVLSFLALDNNAIVSVHTGAFANLTSLQDLNINRNQLSSVPTAIRSLRSLRTVDMGDNKISSLEDLAVRGLKELYGLRLVNNKIEGNISKTTFEDLPSLKVLNLAKNRIDKIEIGAFDSHHKLQAIRLDGNRLSAVDNLFGKLLNLQWLNMSANSIEVFDYSFIPASLLWLGLHNNNIRDLKNDLGTHDLKLEILDVSFNSLVRISSVNFPDSLKMVFLNNNKITNVEPFTFFKQENLTRVDLFSNKLMKLELTALRVAPVPTDKKLPAFYLGYNSFLCDCDMEWLQRINSLEHMRTYPTLMDTDNMFCQMPFTRAGNYLPLQTVKATQFLCEYTRHCFALCHCCEFDACDCEMTCPEGCGCYHEQSWRSNIVDCSLRDHAHVPDNIPMDVSELYLDGNQFNSLSPHSFLGRKHLKKLYVNGSNVNMLDNGTFSGLSRLTALHLEDNYIVALEGKELEGLGLLRELYLHNNSLRYINQQTFSSLSHLEVLTLHDNKLKSFSVWRLVDNPYLARISMKGNLWTCQCQFLNSLEIWLIGNSKKIIDHNELQCFDNGPYGGGLSVLHYNATVCTNSSAISTVVQPLTFRSMLHPLIAICLAFVVVIILAVSLVYKRRIAGVMRNHCGSRATNTCSLDDNDKSYDIFVSYSSIDAPWVNQVLATELERSDYLCLYYRELPATAYISQNVKESFESSKRTIIVISKNFIDNEWCRFQFKHAHIEMMRKHYKRVIFILYGEILIEDLDPDLRVFLKDKDSKCISASDKLFWEKLRFAIPEASCGHRAIHTYSSIPDRGLAHKSNGNGSLRVPERGNSHNKFNGGTPAIVASPSSVHPSMHPSADGTYWA